jgi:hypothetical protein
LNHFQVFLVDVGTSVKVGWTELLKLTDEFAKLPPAVIFFGCRAG